MDCRQVGRGQVQTLRRTERHVATARQDALTTGTIEAAAGSRIGHPYTGWVALPPAVEKAIVAEFTNADLPAIREALPTADELPSSAPYERVVLGIVHLASGNASRVAELSQVARRDWRDIVYWAEVPRTPDEPATWEELKSRLRLPD